MNGILAKKIGMTQVFEESGDLVPVTVLLAYYTIRPQGVGIH